MQMFTLIFYQGDQTAQKLNKYAKLRTKTQANYFCDIVDTLKPVMWIRIDCIRIRIHKI